MSKIKRVEKRVEFFGCIKTCGISYFIIKLYIISKYIIYVVKYTLFLLKYIFIDIFYIFFDNQIINIYYFPY